MILIDAIYVNIGGGKRLLELLISEFGSRPDVLFLLDARLELNAWPKTFEVRHPGEYARWLFYRNRGDSFSKVLCFGNVPPPVRVKGQVKTYFHNRLFLQDVEPLWRTMKGWSSRLKRFYVRALAKNTDSFLVQTPTMRRDIISALGLDPAKVEWVPFYEVGRYSGLVHSVGRRSDVFGYVSLAHKHKGHADLFSAWECLAREGVYPELHLTIPVEHPMAAEVARLAAKGIRVINHGFCNPADIYAVAKYQIYPSSTESFGLGLIESVEAGCQVIAPDLSYVHDVVSPSAVWRLGSEKELVGAVKSAMASELPGSKLHIESKIDDLVRFLTL